MLEGLEINELLLSKIREDNKSFRIESEYFKKEYQLLKQTLISREHTELSKLVKKPIQTGHTPSMKNLNFYGGDINFIKTDNLRDNEITTNFSDTLSEEGNNEIKRTQLLENDIITTIIGATHEVIARSCLVNKQILPANINQNIAHIRVNEKIIQPEVLVAYMNSIYGKKYLRYLSRQTEQVNLNCDEVGQLIIPMFGSEFCNCIYNFIIKANICKEEAQQAYQQAETLLLEAVGLKNFEPSKDPANVKSYKESYLASGRLDAEYYQKKYEDYIKLIRDYRNGFELLESACNLKDDNFTPKDAEEYKYIELADVGKSGDITGCTVSMGKELPTRARRLVKENDVIISSIEGSLESCAVITEEYNKALCSTGFYVINSPKLNSETLLVLFKSELMQNVLKQSCSGTILTSINKEDLKKIPIPLIEEDVQLQVKIKIAESSKLRQQSNMLLETAKRAVEMAIEQSEEEALKLIKQSGS